MGKIKRIWDILINKLLLFIIYYSINRKLKCEYVFINELLI